MFEKWSKEKEKVEKAKGVMPPFLKCTAEFPDKIIKASKDKDGNQTFYFEYLILLNPGEKEPQYGEFLYDFGNQITGSNPKLPPKTNENTAKYMNIKFYDISDGKIFNDSPLYKSPEKRKIWLDGNASLVKALKIIHDAFEECGRRIINDNVLRSKFAIGAPKKGQPLYLKTNSFCQTERKATPQDKTTEPTVPLEHPLFSARIKLNPKDRTFSFQYGENAQLTPLLYDFLKMKSQTEKKTDIPYTYMENGVAKFPNIYNIGNFITYRSGVFGHSQFHGVHSSQGLSIHWEMKKIYVLTHPKMAASVDEVKMQAFLDGFDEDQLDAIDEPSDMSAASAPLSISNKKNMLIIDEDNTQVAEPEETETKAQDKEEVSAEDFDEAADQTTTEDTTANEEETEEAEEVEEAKPKVSAKKKVGVPSPPAQPTAPAKAAAKRKPAQKKA